MSSESRAAPSPRFRRLGRTLVYVAFACATLYVPAAIFKSVLASLYGGAPVSGAASAAAQRDWCARSLVGLRDELEGQVTSLLQYPRLPGSPLERWRMWEESWTERMHEASRRCAGEVDGGLAQAYGQLERLHEAYATGVFTILKARAELAPPLSDVVRAVGPPQPERE